MVAQRPALVLLAEQAAALEFRHDERHEVLVGARHVGRGDDEAVAAAFLEPLLHPVGDLLRPADPGVVQLAAAAVVDEVAHGRVGLAAVLEHAVADRL